MTKFKVITTKGDEVATCTIPKGFETAKWRQDSLYEPATLAKGLNGEGTHTIKEFCKMPSKMLLELLTALPPKQEEELYKGIASAYRKGLYGNKKNYERFIKTRKKAREYCA